ncbi:MAG: hypothetical protein EXQ71_03495 [Acidimicrobiia bacterium]|nr:hypothetical protein [Acidimicrobiia bacterium]
MVELRRLVGLSLAYRRIEDAEEAMTDGGLATALAIYADSMARQPDQQEFPFWPAVLLAGVGRHDEARVLVGPVLAGPQGDGWRELLRRLPAAGLLDEVGVAGLLDRR